jgi:hypothetical protein
MFCPTFPFLLSGSTGLPQLKPDLGQRPRLLHQGVSEGGD